MVTGLTEFKFPSNFANSSLGSAEAENVLARIPDLVNKAVKWFEGEFNRADALEKRKREVSLRKMMVSSVKQSETFIGTNAM